MDRKQELTFAHAMRVGQVRTARTVIVVLSSQRMSKHRNAPFADALMIAMDLITGFVTTQTITRVRV